MTKFVLLIGLYLTGFQLAAQTNDALLWTSASLTGKINKSFNFELNTQCRFAQNMSRFSSGLVQGVVDYEVSKPLNIALGYRLSNSRGTDNFSLKNRLFSDINFDHEVLDNVDIELRLRVQHDFDRLNAINTYILPKKRSIFRFRYGMQYSYKDWKPSLSNEFFFNADDSKFSAYRIIGGLGYRISKRHKVKFEYTFQRNTTNIISNEHIYQVAYKYNLKGKLIK